MERKNMYGGFENEWTSDSGTFYRLDEAVYPRYQQFYLSLDADLSRIKNPASGNQITAGSIELG